MNDHDRFDETIRRALAREAAAVEPGSDGLHAIQRKIRARQPAYRRPWLLATGGAVLGTAAAVGLFAVLDTDRLPLADRTQQPAGPPSLPATPVPSPSPAEPSTDPASPVSSRVIPSSAAPPSTTTLKPRGTSTVPLYWMGATAGRPDLGPRLYRTFAKVTGVPAVAAVEQLTTGKPDDPDYSSAWAGARVSTVTRSGGVTTVDFSRLPATRLGKQAARVAAQALVYTVQGTLTGDDPIRVTLDGGPAGDLFGQVDTGTPIRRAAANDVQAAIWITAPANGASAGSSVRVTGIASVFEASVNWTVRDPSSGTVVREGYATAAEGMRHSPFSFTVKLAKGNYLIECFESSPEDSRPTSTDTKSITVR